MGTPIALITTSLIELPLFTDGNNQFDKIIPVKFTNLYLMKKKEMI